MSDTFASDSPLLIIPAKDMPNSRRARYAPVYKGVFAAGFLMYTIWQLIQILILEVTYKRQIPDALQSYFTCASASCGIVTMASLYLVISAGTDVVLRDAFLKANTDHSQLNQIRVKTATLGRLWWYGPHDYITYTPSLAALIERLREPIVRSASEKVAQPLTLQQIRILEPVKQVILSLSDKLTVLLIGRDGSKMTIFFPLKSYRAAFLLYLAIVGQKTSVLTGEFLDTVYYNTSRSTFNADTSRRIHEIIVNAALRKGFRPFKLFRSDRTFKKWAWRFAKPCGFKDIDEVYEWSNRIAAVRAGMAPPPLEDLRRLADLIMTQISELYLIPLLKHRAYQQWALDAVKDLCRKRLYIITYAAQREFVTWLENSSSEEASLRRAAKYYKWCMRMAIKVMHDRNTGDGYRQLCVEMYQHLQDYEAMKHIDELFRKLERELPREDQ